MGINDLEPIVPAGSFALPLEIAFCDKVDYDNLRDFKKVIPEVQREKAPKDNEKSDLQPVKKHKK